MFPKENNCPMIMIHCHPDWFAKALAYTLDGCLSLTGAGHGVEDFPITGTIHRVTGFPIFEGGTAAANPCVFPSLSLCN